jgi:hypothetical protein
MDRKTAIEFLGKTGEKIVANHFVKNGEIVEHSLNNFDSEKDFLIGGKKVEVKTEQPYVKKNSITIRQNQIKKCRNVDLLIFVTVPPLFNMNYKWGGYMFNVDPKNFICENYQTKSGTAMTSISIEQESVSVIRKLTDEEVSELVKYAQSAYTK